MTPFAVIKTEKDHWYDAVTSFGSNARGVRLAGIGAKFYPGQKVAVFQCGNEYGFSELNSHKSQLSAPDAQKLAITSQSPASVALAFLANLANNKRTIYRPAKVDQIISPSQIKTDGIIVPSMISNFYEGARCLLKLDKISKAIGWWNCLANEGEETDGDFQLVDLSDFPPAPTVDYSKTKDGKFWLGNPGGRACLQGDTADDISTPVFDHDGDNYGSFFPHRFSSYPDPDAKVVWISRYYFTSTVFMALIKWVGGEVVIEKVLTVSPSDPRCTTAFTYTYPTTNDDPYLYTIASFGVVGAIYETQYIRWLKY